MGVAVVGVPACVPEAILCRSQLDTVVYREQGSQNRWEPVRFDRLPVKPIRTGSGLGRYQTGPNSKFKFEFKKMKNFQKKS